MAARIDTVVQSPGLAVLKVAGRLVQREALTLDAAIAGAAGRSWLVLLDLQAVPRLDYQALAVLRRWAGPMAGHPSRVRVQLRRGKPFLRVLLQLHGIPIR